MAAESKIIKVPFQRLADSPDVPVSELEEAAVNVIRSGWYLRGEQTEMLETDLSHICGTNYCVAVSNGLDALRLMFRAYIELGYLKPGDEVIYPANTYIASVLPITEFGLVPVPVEPSVVDFNLDFSKLDKAVTPRTKAILLVHLYGNPCWNETILKRLHSQGILIFEDNAQAIGAETAEDGLFMTRTTGGLGDCAAISFYPSKNIGALGDAGAVTTKNPEVANMVRTLANYGSRRRYHNDYCGYNCRMDEIQAAMLRVKLKRITQINNRRREMASLYDTIISNPVIENPQIFNDRRQVWHQYVILSTNRNELQEYLSKNGIGTEIHYPVPVHKQACYRKYFGPVSLPVTDRLAEMVLSLPIANVSRSDVEYVAEVINAFVPDRI